MTDQSKQQRGRRERRGKRRVEREAQEAQRRKRYMIGGGIIAAFILVIAAITIIEVIGEDEDAGDDFPAIVAASATHGDVPSEPYFLGDPDAPIHLIEWSDYQ